MVLKALAMEGTLKNRILRRHGCLVILTGARQTGKTTLACRSLPGISYVSVEDPVVRPSFTRLSAMDWIERYPTAVVDEVQKAPPVIEALKAAHDASGHARYVLLGSSQILRYPSPRAPPGDSCATSG